MSTLGKKWLCSLALAGALLFAWAGTSHAQVGIAPYYMKHYKHATQVLEQRYPAFLDAFETLQQDMSMLDSNNKEAQFYALMRFLPYVEKMTQVDGTSWKEEGVTWNLTTEVVVTYFVMHFWTRDNVKVSVDDLLFDMFMVYIAGGDAVGILPEKTLQDTYQLDAQQAHHIRMLLRTLYPTRSLL